MAVTSPLTAELAKMCEESGVPYSFGLYSEGERVEDDGNHITIGIGMSSLTFEESDGAFDCIDGMSVPEAFAAGVCAWASVR